MNMSAPSRTICELMNNPSSKPIPRDIVFGTEKVIVELNRNDKQSSNKYDLDNKDVAPIAAFRRCSLDEHMKRLKSAGSRNAISNTTKLLQKPPPAPPSRRSSLKASSFSTSVLGSIKKKKKVVFRKHVSTTIIEYRDEKYTQAAWLSSEERANIKVKAKEDVKVMKHLKKHPEILESSSEMRNLYASISLRGLEAFISKKARLALCLNQQRAIHEVLETQDLFFESSVDVKAQMLAKVSAERSLSSRERARELGQEDMSTVLRHFKQSKSTANMSANHCLRQPSFGKQQHVRSKSIPLGKSAPVQMPNNTNIQLRDERGRSKSLPSDSIHFSDLDGVDVADNGYHSGTSGSEHAVC